MYMRDQWFEDNQMVDYFELKRNDSILNDYDKNKELILSTKTTLSVQGELIFEYQSIRKYNSSLVSMIDEEHNNQGKYGHQESHGLDVLINKGVLITSYISL